MSIIEDFNQYTQPMANRSNYSTNPFLDYTGGTPASSVRDMLEYKPSLAYYSSPTGQAFAGRGGGQRQYFQRSFGDIYNEYLGQLGSQIRETGTAPTRRFEDFLADDPFTRRYTRMSPGMRRSFGETDRSSFSPTTRLLYY